jgi:phosphatidylserine decarboxylase
VVLQQGQEMGRFMLGSTVVMLFPQGPLQFTSDWAAARPIQLGEAMAQRASL